MNIFEVTDYGGDKLSVDLDQNDPPIQSGRFMATIISHETPITCESVIFTDDAARALIKALRENLPPEELGVVQNNTGRDEPVTPTYQLKRADYIRQAFQLLRDQRMEFCPGDVVQLAYFLSETGS